MKLKKNVQWIVLQVLAILFCLISAYAQNDQEFQLENQWDLLITNCYDTTIYNPNGCCNTIYGQRYGIESYRFDEGRKLIGVVSLLGDPVNFNPPPGHTYQVKEDNIKENRIDQGRVAHEGVDSALVVIGYPIRDKGLLQHPNSQSLFKMVGVNRAFVLEWDFQPGQYVWVIPCSETGFGSGSEYKIVCQE